MLEVSGTVYPDGWVKAKLGTTAIFYRRVEDILQFHCITREWGMEPIRWAVERICRYNQWEIEGYLKLRSGTTTLDQWMVDKDIPVRVGFWRNLAQTLHIVSVRTKKVRGALTVGHQEGLPKDVTNPTYVQSMTHGSVPVIAKAYK